MMCNSTKIVITGVRMEVMALFIGYPYSRYQYGTIVLNNTQQCALLNAWKY